MKTVCPYCGTSFVRHPRAVLANQFCKKCINERVNHDGKGKYPRDYLFTIDKDGYSQFEPIDFTV